MPHPHRACSGSWTTRQYACPPVSAPACIGRPPPFASPCGARPASPCNPVLTAAPPLHCGEYPPAPVGSAFSIQWRGRCSGIFRSFCIPSRRSPYIAPYVCRSWHSATSRNPRTSPVLRRAAPRRWHFRAAWRASSDALCPTAPV